MKAYVDKSGRELKVGDFIIYGSLLGRCAGLKYGKVLQLYESKGDEYTKPKKRLKVVSVDDNWSHRGPELCKPGYLEFSERILKIGRNLIPESVLSLLDT